MKPSRRTLGLVTAALLACGAAGLAVADSDDDDDDDNVAPVTNATYAEECGACHMAYQPGLLPAAAWQQIMRTDALADHYGDDASLSDDLSAEITAYLSANSAGKASRSRAFAVGDVGGVNLPRITETRYFVKEHDEIPARMVADNADVGSFSNCNACHQGAAEGVYDEDRVKIPGFGRWED